MIHCSCGATYTLAQWRQLDLLGIQTDVTGGPSLELRQCRHCQSTRAVEIHHYRCRACGDRLDLANGETSHMCSKVCTVCKHPACPCCGDWCDTLIGDDHDELCCEGECTYPANTLKP